MLILGIDPGTTDSAFCFYKGKIEGKHDAKHILAKDKIPNDRMRSILLANIKHSPIVYIEDIAFYGGATGKTTFDTLKFIGRLIEICAIYNIKCNLPLRKTIVSHLLDNPKANDKMVRQFLIDTYGVQGTQKNKGPLYGFANDMFSALLIATFGYEMEELNVKKSNHP